MNDLIVFEKGGMVNYDAAIYYLTESHKIDEVKNFRDQAKAIEAICKVANNLDAERLAREIRIRAEKKAGSLLKATLLPRGGRPKDNPSTSTRGLKEGFEAVMTLQEMGITYDQSSTWQQLDDVPEELFEEMVTTNQIPSTKSIIKASKPKVEVPQLDKDSLRIWGKTEAFEYQNDESYDPVELYQGMTEPMREGVKRNVPRIIKFWQNFMEANNLLYADDSHRRNA